MASLFDGLTVIAHEPACAVVFDMDGVLLDSEPLHHAVVNEVLAAEGVSLGDDEYTRYIGTTDEDTWRDLIERYALRDPLQDYRTRYDAAILRAYRRYSVPAEGARSLVAGLCARGVKLAVASSSRQEWVETALASLGFAEAFDVVITGDMVARGKPDPEIYLRAADGLKLPPSLCLAIEDSPHGIAAACAAGMRAIGVRTRYTDTRALAHAHAVLDGLTQFDYAWVRADGAMHGTLPG
jgi:HAD superfamily hydrolase (TIGR01509 family)